MGPRRARPTSREMASTRSRNGVGTAGSPNTFHHTARTPPGRKARCTRGSTAGASIQCHAVAATTAS